MPEIHVNHRLTSRPRLFAGDYEVVGPDPALGHRQVSGLGVDLIFIHYHHRHEFSGGGNKGLWGTLYQGRNEPDWDELDRTVASARRHFPLVGLYPIGWAHMVPEALGETIQEVDPEQVADWVARVVERYWRQVDIFPIFYEINVFDLFFRVTHGQAYGDAQKRHIIECLALSLEKVQQRSGPEAASRLTAATFVELTRSSFYWMSEGKLLELPKGTALLEAPLSPPDLVATARALDALTGGRRYTSAIRQLLHQLVFWNADDSGAANTVGDDLYRLLESGLIHHPTLNPEGVARMVIAGWDAQPQNTYEYLLARLAPERPVPTTAECLQANHDAFGRFLADENVAAEMRQRIIGFVLDDVFKCTKQSGITSAVYPTETVLPDGKRVGKEPLFLSDMGATYQRLIRARERTTPQANHQ